MWKGFILFGILVIFQFSDSFPTKIIYFTTDGSKNGTKVESGFEFNHIWTAVGVGKNKHIYAAVSNTARSHSPGSNDAGNACIVSYNPYQDVVKSCGTVKQACQSVGNWMSNESQEKVHTYLQCMPDGRLWMATHDNDESNSFFRGSHLLYVDTDGADTLVDYSNMQRYYYKKQTPFPDINQILLPPSDSSRITLQWHSIMTIGLNPHNPRYLWTQSMPSGYIQVWDLFADTTRTVATAGGDMREMAVSKDGSAYYTASSNACKRTVHGQLKLVGTSLPYSANCMVYSHSFDSAYSLPRQTGEVVLWDFVNDTAKVIGNMPDDSSLNMAYRAAAISSDGKKLYVLGNGGRIYEFTIATGSYTQIDNISSELSAFRYAAGRNIIDSIGNWYIGVHNSSIQGGAALIQVTLGKDKVNPLVIPDSGPEIEQASIIEKEVEPMTVSPNPFCGRVKIRIQNTGFWRQNFKVEILNINGKIIDILPAELNVLRSGLEWNALTQPPGLYLVRVTNKNKTYTKRILLRR